MRRGSIIGALAAASLGVGLAATPVAIVDERPGRRQAPPGGYRGNGSIADKPHKHGREIARRLRQAERNAERQRERYLRKFDRTPPYDRGRAPENVGQTRRGGLVFL